MDIKTLDKNAFKFDYKDETKETTDFANPLLKNRLVTDEHKDDGYAVKSNAFASMTMEETSQETVMKHVETKAERAQRYEEESKALSEMDNRYSYKDRKKLMEQSDEINKKVAKKKLELENAKQRNISKEKEYKLKVEILKLESESRKSLIKARSVDQEGEDYALGLEEIRLQNRLQEAGAAGLDEYQFDEVKEEAKTKRAEVRKKLAGNSHFLDFRKRMVKRVLDKSPKKSAIALKKKAAELYSIDETELMTVTDFAVETENLLQNDESRAIDEMIKALTAYKEKMGGTPNFPDSEPLLDAEMYNAFRFNDRTLSHYEYACLYLRSMRRLALFKPYIKAAFQEDKEKQTKDIQRLSPEKRKVWDNLIKIYKRYEEGGAMFRQLTGMICHSNSNGAGVESEQCDQALKVLLEQYQFAKEEKREEDFFKKLEGVCFDHRLSMLMEYADKHKIVDKTEKDLPAPEDGSLYIKKLSEVTGMGLVSDDNLAQAPAKILRATALSNGMNPDDAEFSLKWSQIEPEIRRHMFGKKFQNLNDQYLGNGEQILVDEEVMGRIKDLMVNIMGMVQEG